MGHLGGISVTSRACGPVLGAASLILFVATLLGCAGTPSHYGRRCVSSDLESRTCYALGPAPGPCQVCLPPGVDFEDGLSEDEAVVIALWNNGAYQELLAELGITGAEIIEAAQLTNPRLWTVFPVGVKQLEFTLYVPLEAIWLRPRRLAAAKLKSHETANRLVQDGLDLIRDVRVAYADLTLAQDRLQVAKEGVRLNGRIAELALARVSAGSASELDASTARIDQLREKQKAAALEHEVELARQHLRYLLGVESSEIRVDPIESSAMGELTDDVEALVDQALAVRPDLQAAESAYEAAEQRVVVARREVLQISAILPDANSRGEKGFEAGPGLDLTIPIFHQNQGAIARAEAEVDKADRHYTTLCDTIALEVRQAYTRYFQAREALQTWDDEIVPSVEEAIARAEKAYLGGGTSLLLMLETSRQLLDSQVQRAEAAAARRRAAAQLERSVGWRVFETPTAALAAGEESP
jgi:cobalt-zinc-cadmium efflux system outer membrane protein